MLQASRALLEQGKTDDARQLLSEAVAAAGDDLQSAALRVELERRERARVLAAAPAGLPAEAEVVPGWSWRRTSPVAILVGSVVALLLLVGGLALIDVNEIGWPAAPSAAASSARVSAPSSSEVALIRARALFVRGRLSEALQKLDAVAPSSAQRIAADELRIEIQQLLLASVRSSTFGGSTPTEAIRR